MNDTPHRNGAAIAAEWAAILAESEAELAAWLVVSGDEIMRELRESVARMEGSEPAEYTAPTTGSVACPLFVALFRAPPRTTFSAGNNCELPQWAHSIRSPRRRPF